MKMRTEEGEMKLSVAYQGGTRYDLVTDRHRVVTDQPVEEGGTDAGMSPVELFVGSVASCVGYFVGQFCARHDISREGLKVEAEWTMAEGPHRVGQVQLAIRLPHRVTPELKERLLKVAYGCTVHQSLVVPARIAIDLNPHSHGATAPDLTEGKP
jgi:putative redox protein